MRGISAGSRELWESNGRRQVDRDGPLDSAGAAGLCLQVRHALAEAHGNGIVHRDLKPDGTANAASFLRAPIALDPVPPSKRIGRPIDPEREGVAMRCLRKAPGERYQTALELAAALEPINKRG